MKNMLNHAMKTTTLPNPETQVRIQQIKLGVDWPAHNFRLARLHTGTGPLENAHAGKPESGAGNRGAIVQPAYEHWANPGPEEIWGHSVGEAAGEMILQLYLSQPVASITRNVEVLQGFQKVRLQPGETKRVTFRITPDD